jgi:hypothetical protein
MSQLAQWGDMGLVNDLAGLTIPLVQSGTPGAPASPNIYWVNTGSGNAINQWNGTAWVTSPTPGTRYLALLTADPVNTAAGTPVVNLSDAGFVELGVAGYARQIATWSSASAVYPSVSSNTNLVTWGPLSASMPVPAQWVALVTSASGTATGYILASWQLVSGVQVGASQSIQLGIGQLVIQGQ